jgi:hypothetical protein
MGEQGQWKLTLARWREKRRTKRQQAAERRYDATTRAARAARQRELDHLEKYRDPGGGGVF